MISNVPTQRTLHGPQGSKAVPRATNSAEHQARLAARLTPRDRWLARMLFEHKVFTTHHIAEMAFASVRAANLRLLALYRWRIVDRFQPHVVTGSAPMHYVLDVAGATVVAREEAVEPDALAYKHSQEIGRAYSLQLAHTVAANQVFAGLIEQSRRPGAAGELSAWWSAHRCGRYFGDVVRPDGYGRWLTGGQATEWFLELDWGTEPLPRLAAKVARYAKLASATGIVTPVLVWLPTRRREANAVSLMADAVRGLDEPAHVPVATTSTDATDPANAWNAAAPRWRRVDQSGPDRVSLAHLGRLWPNLRAALPNRPASSLPSPAPAPLLGTNPTGKHHPVAPAPVPPPMDRYRAGQVR